MKNTNVLLLKELKDIKNVLKECYMNLPINNQNSEIVERIKLVSVPSRIECEFENFLKGDDVDIF